MSAKKCIYVRPIEPHIFAGGGGGNGLVVAACARYSVKSRPVLDLGSIVHCGVSILIYKLGYEGVLSCGVFMCLSSVTAKASHGSFNFFSKARG